MKLTQLTNSLLRASHLAQKMLFVGATSTALFIAEQALATELNKRPDQRGNKQKTEFVIPNQTLTYRFVFPFEPPKNEFEKSLLEKLGDIDYMKVKRGMKDAGVIKELFDAITNPNPLIFNNLLHALKEQGKLTEYVPLEDRDIFNLIRPNYQGTIDPTRPRPKPKFYQTDRYGNLIPLDEEQKYDLSTPDKTIELLMQGIGQNNHSIYERCFVRKSKIEELDRALEQNQQGVINQLNQNLSNLDDFERLYTLRIYSRGEDIVDDYERFGSLKAVQKRMKELDKFPRVGYDLEYMDWSWKLKEGMWLIE